MRRLINRYVVMLLLFGALLSAQPGSLFKPPARAAQRNQASHARVVGWAAVPAILARIKPPQFPARDFKITDYGATPGGTSDCTEAIRQAIAACHGAGGGRVVVPPGVFLTGAIHLLSNVNLYLTEGATLK